MINIVNPRQKTLFDQYEVMLPDKVYQKLTEDWYGVMRFVILELMPVDVLSARRHETHGRPTKELYSVAGLLFIKDFMGWTVEETVAHYSLHVGIQFALNLPPMGASICERTIENYQAFFREDDAGAEIFERVTVALVKALNTKLDQQRGDSVHIFSDMAMFGRTQLMGVAVKRFLTQLIRHDCDAYDALEQALRERYLRSANMLFADTSRDNDSRKRLRQDVAEDMFALIRRFDDDEKHNTRTSYKALKRIFFEQCEVKEEQVTVKAKAGGRVMQNPSDPDATYDGKKGPGYQAQITQTCSDENDVQLITSVIPQTAADTDAESLVTILGELKASGRLPASLLLDAAYGSDTNVQAGKKDGVEVISPVNTSKRDPDKLHVEDFTIDPLTEKVHACPAGHKPLESVYDTETGTTKTTMDAGHCAQCPQKECCPMNGKQTRTFSHTPGERRRAERFHAEQDPEWRKRYAKRAGIEGLMSCLKRRTGLGRLRVRGRPAVSHAIYLKAAGWNLLQAAKAPAMRKIIAERAAPATKCAKVARACLKNALSALTTPHRGLRRAFFRGLNYA